MDYLLQSLQDDSLVARLAQWGAEHQSIRAILLSGSRANPAAVVDELSDYDVILVVPDIRPYASDRLWLGDFGNVLVTYWDPIYRSPESGCEVVGSVIQYAGGHGIDFTLWPLEHLSFFITNHSLPAELDQGYTVLLDKDGLSAGLPPASHQAFIPRPPSPSEFYKLVEDFYSDVPYVTKCLLRDELMPAKWVLDGDMRQPFLRQMLEWRVELDHDWKLAPGFLGKGLKKHLSSETWQALEQTYAGADLEENWQAFFNLLQLFHQVGEQVAAGLGYSFPIELHQKVTAFARQRAASSLHDPAPQEPDSVNGGPHAPGNPG